MTFVCALRWSWPGDPSTWVRVRRHPSALSSPLLCIIQSGVDTHAASISFKWAALMQICILVTVSACACACACLFVSSCTIGTWQLGRLICSHICSMKQGSLVASHKGRSRVRHFAGVYESWLLYRVTMYVAGVHRELQDGSRVDPVD